MTYKFQKLVFASLIFLINGCVPNSNLVWENPSCHEGWITNKDGKSKVWIPSNDELTTLASMLPENRTLYCWHGVPNGDVFVMNSDENGNHFSNNFYKSGPIFVKGEEEIVVTLHH